MTMKVLLAPADMGGCGHYRMIFPGEALHDQGEVECEINQHLPIQRTLSDRPKVVKVGDLDCDVLVLQRPLQRILCDAIPLFQKKGIPVVVDLDDDFSCLHSAHLARHIYNPRKDPETNWEHLRRSCARADLVTVSTPQLAKRYHSRNGTLVLPNCVPEWYTRVKHKGDGRTVGWSGYTTMHPGDLEVTRGGVQRALSSADGRFAVVGNGLEVQKALHLAEEPEVIGPVELPEYPEALSHIDVGIVPLGDTQFNAAKSYLKGLEFSSLGTPFVASDVAEYRTLAETGLGVLARAKSKDWSRQIAHLLKHDDLRQEQGAAARRAVVEHHTYEGQAWRWAEAWEFAREQRLRKNLAIVG